MNTQKTFWGPDERTWTTKSCVSEIASAFDPGDYTKEEWNNNVRWMVTIEFPEFVHLIKLILQSCDHNSSDAEISGQLRLTLKKMLRDRRDIPNFETINRSLRNIQKTLRVRDDDFKKDKRDGMASKTIRIFGS